jgi:hypothetical protein
MATANTLSASRPGAGSVVVAAPATSITTQIVGVGVVGQAGTTPPAAPAAQYAVTINTG